MSGILVAHSGARVIKEELLQFLEIPYKESSRWKAIAHTELLKELKKGILNLGFEIIKEIYSIDLKKDALFGVIDLKTYLDKGEYCPSIGFRHSNDKSLALRLVGGVKVFVCDNLALSGDTLLLRSLHKPGLDLEAKFKSALPKVFDSIDEFTKIIHKWKNTSIEGEKEIYRLYLYKVMPTRSFEYVSKEWERSKDKNVWTLHNICTSYLGKLKQGKQIETTVKLGKALLTSLS